MTDINMLTDSLHLSASLIVILCLVLTTGCWIVYILFFRAKFPDSNFRLNVKRPLHREACISHARKCESPYNYVPNTATDKGIRCDNGDNHSSLESEISPNQLSVSDDPTISPSQDSREKLTDIIGFSKYSPYWAAIGVSVTGSGHIQTGLPCQDNNIYQDLGDGWAIAVISDGAGSASLSHIGSRIIVERTALHFKNLLHNKDWKELNTLPSDEEWNEASFLTLKLVYDDLASYAASKSINIADLNATVILAVLTPSGILACHIGDGRAGYLNQAGDWMSLFTPHKGEEANQTIFLTSDFWKIPYFRISGVRVPEAVVIRNTVNALTMMSDGCENTCWQCNLFNSESGKFYDPNLPYPNFFNNILHTLIHSFKSGEKEDDILEAWHSFVEKGNEGFIEETDDKTLVLIANSPHFIQIQTN